MNALFWLIDNVLGIYVFLIFVWVVISWLVAFNVINTYNQFVRTVMHFLHKIMEPACAPIRRVIPPIGGIDLSPLVLLLAVQFFRYLIWNDIRPAILY